MADVSVSVEDLVRKSHEAKQFAYCPYSHFRVGAALLSVDGTVFTGCNVENASYSLGVCAERTAILNAVSHGHRKFKSIAIATDMPDTWASPCGACRQVMLEFGGDYEVYLSKPDFNYKTMTPSDLLPLGFRPDTLVQQQTLQSKQQN